MTNLVLGANLAGQPGTGSVEKANSPLDNSGATNTNYAIGAFTDWSGLPQTIADDDDFLDFGAALMAKTSEVYDGGVSLTNISSNLFFGAGGGGNDIFDVANSGAGIIEGRGGDDTLSLKGNTDDATLNGGDGDDVLFGRGVTVLMLGGDGDDILKPMGVDSTVEGGAGNDTLELIGFGHLTVSLAETGPQSVGAGGGTDTLSGIENLRTGVNHDSLTGSDASNLLDGGSGDDTISAGKGDDTLVGGLGHNVLDGGGGFDWISYAATPSAMTVLLYNDLIIRNGFTDADTATDVEGIVGTGFADDLAGDGQRNAIVAGDGGDAVQGMENSDTLDGGLGNDGVYGDEGDDLVAGGAGDDTIDGGADNDTADYRSSLLGVTVSLALAGGQITGGAGIDDLRSIENVIGSQGKDSLSGNEDANRLDGRGAKDAIAGGGGDDTLLGGFGKDAITGGSGSDVMTGGDNKDRYFFNSIGDVMKAAPDLITDLANEDRISLLNIDANVNKGGDQAFDLVADFTGKAGQAVLKYNVGSDTTRLQLDVNGDGVADGQILLSGNHTDFTNIAL